MTALTILANLRKNLMRICNTTNKTANTNNWKCGVMEMERYLFDFGLDLRIWKQYDTNQDAPYFGVWVNTETREVLTFSEGDIGLLECQDKKTFREHLALLHDFYGAAPHWATVITETAVKQLHHERPTA